MAIALVGPVGVSTRAFVGVIKERLTAFGYTTEPIHLSDLIRELHGKGCLRTTLVQEPEFDRIRTYMDGGDELRQVNTGILAHAAVSGVAGMRAPDLRRRSSPTRRRRPIPGRAWLFNSVKHQDEVAVLRSVYGEGFFLIGIFATEAARLHRLTRLGMTSEQAIELIKRDIASGDECGQQTREAFKLADAWVSNKHEVHRVLDLLFGAEFEVPSDNEFGMSLAYSLARAPPATQV